MAMVCKMVHQHKNAIATRGVHSAPAPRPALSYVGRIVAFTYVQAFLQCAHNAPIIARYYLFGRRSVARLWIGRGGGNRGE